jgi:hypothetical protein
MRTETKTRVLYEFDELSEDAKDKAIEKLYDINVDHDWWNWVYEDARGAGIKITSFDVGYRQSIEGEFILSANEVAQNILNNHGDMCETYKIADAFMKEWQPIFDDYMDSESAHYESWESEEKLMDIESKFLRSLLEDYRVILREEYEYLQTREAIVGTIKANKYEFDEQGNWA